MCIPEHRGLRVERVRILPPPPHTMTRMEAALASGVAVRASDLMPDEEPPVMPKTEGKQLTAPPAAKAVEQKAVPPKLEQKPAAPAAHATVLRRPAAAIITVQGTSARDALIASGQIRRSAVAAAAEKPTAAEVLSYANNKPIAVVLRMIAAAVEYQLPAGVDDARLEQAPREICGAVRAELLAKLPEGLLSPLAQLAWPWYLQDRSKKGGKRR